MALCKNKVGTIMKKISLLTPLSKITDPRIQRHKRYPLQEILFLVISANLCGVYGWRDMVEFGKAKIKFLRKYLSFKKGIPSKTTLSNLFSRLIPAEFQRVFCDFFQQLQMTTGEVVAIDGKTLKRSFDTASNQSPIHLITAFATNVRTVLAQEKVDSKSNEITAIPNILEMLDLTGMIVSIDAIGTQKNIATQICEKKADYILALKGNQSSLHKAVINCFDKEILNFNSKKLSKITSVFEHFDKGHGRVESRICYVIDDLTDLQMASQWTKLKTIVAIKSQVNKNDKTTTQIRYFISSLESNAEKIAKAVRDHWAIENNLHWILDVTFNEDYSRIRKDHAPENMAFMRRFALNILQKAYVAGGKKTGIKILQHKASWIDEELEKLLRQTPL